MKKIKKYSPPFSYRIFASETVVYDRKGKRVVGCPTEQEAIEVIKRLETDEGKR